MNAPADPARPDRLAEAQARVRAAATTEPTASSLDNLGVARQLLGDHAAAEVDFRRALALDPTRTRARAMLGLSLLAQGRMAEGFACYDAWRELPDSRSGAAPDLGAPWWSGEDVAGKNLLVWGEEGLGDQIMYARFAPLLQAAGGEVIWVCNPALERLVREGLGMAAVAARKGALAIEGLDYAVPSSRLPVVFMQSLAAPPPAPYLRPPSAVVSPGRSLGVVARGNPHHANDFHRSLSPDAAAELLALPGAVSLLPEDTGARDFWDTAALIAGLELVITVDTAIAHLAGALGKPVWLLLPAFGCDWRWGLGRPDSPWYPSMRLFRQTIAGDWAGVVREVRAALGER